MGWGCECASGDIKGNIGCDRVLVTWTKRPMEEPPPMGRTMRSWAGSVACDVMWRGREEEGGEEDVEEGGGVSIETVNV